MYSIIVVYIMKPHHIIYIIYIWHFILLIVEAKVVSLE
jgi:hypothetical protein